MKHLVFTLVLFALTSADCLAEASCPVTLPSSSPVEVPASGSSNSFAWFGSEALAVRLPADGRWQGMGRARNYFDKFWVWRRGYDAKTENRPDLTFTGVKLNSGDNPERMNIEGATNAFGDGWSQMLVGMEFPSAGCWQVTAKYVHAGITQELTFVVEVIDSQR